MNPGVCGRRYPIRVIARLLLTGASALPGSALAEPPFDVSPGVTEPDQDRDGATQRTAELDIAMQAYGVRPRRKFVSDQSNKEDIYTAYVHRLDNRLLHIGNLDDTEDDAYRAHHGDLIVTIAIKRDGSLDDIKIVKSSGQHALDETAVRIVRGAAPFEPLPDDPNQHIDILHVTRSWRFLPDDMPRDR